jgi:hypothetical protein
MYENLIEYDYVVYVDDDVRGGVLFLKEAYYHHLNQFHYSIFQKYQLL